MADHRSISRASRAAPPRLTAGEAIEVAAHLATALADLHGQGKLHGELEVARVEIESPCAKLPALDGDCAVLDDDERCPPELRTLSGCAIPRDLAAAEEFLRDQHLHIDPRRIDVYQLGVVICHLAGADSLGSYLRSPRTRAQLPPVLQLLIDRALGFDADHRCQTMVEMQQALQQAQRASVQTAETPPPDTRATDTELPVSVHRQLEAFESLGNYQILGRIGSGGMGDVFKAFDPALSREVAIKVLPRELQSEDSIRRFRAEAAAVARFVHPNVIPIYAFGEDEGRHFFVMQYVPGESLAVRLDREIKLPADEALRICELCLEGLIAAQEQGLVHRDIKPGNILLNPDTGHVLLADFGLVKCLRQEASTSHGTLVGTVEYLAPEQARGESVDGRADLYSLGIVLYEMLSGTLPFLPDSTAITVFRHAYGRPTPLLEVAPDTPPELAAIVMRMLQADLDTRYQSAAEVLEDLRRFRNHEPISPTPEPLPEQTLPAEPEPTSILFQRDLALAIAVTTGLLLAALFVFYSSSRSTDIADVGPQLEGLNPAKPADAAPVDPVPGDAAPVAPADAVVPIANKPNNNPQRDEPPVDDSENPEDAKKPRSSTKVTTISTEDTSVDEAGHAVRRTVTESTYVSEGHGVPYYDPWGHGMSGSRYPYSSGLGRPIGPIGSSIGSRYPYDFPTSIPRGPMLPTGPPSGAAPVTPPLRPEVAEERPPAAMRTERGTAPELPTLEHPPLSTPPAEAKNGPAENVVEVFCEIPAVRTFEHEFEITEEKDEISHVALLSTEVMPVRYAHHDILTCGLQVSVIAHPGGPHPIVVWQLATAAPKFIFFGEDEKRAFHLTLDGQETAEPNSIFRHPQMVKGTGWVERAPALLKLDEFLKVIACENVAGKLGDVAYELDADHLECLRDLASRLPTGTAILNEATVLPHLPGNRPMQKVPKLIGEEGTDFYFTVDRAQPPEAEAAP